ncbi:hypothetical protein DRQ20_01795 [bacterium]|nr:MAG: hypothetical protein DRQ20_01795 [bacterium]
MREDFRISIENFEGPLELLLYLVRKKEVDIYDIPILEIVREYQEWVRLMERLNLDRAGEFSSMLATLMVIKSKMLLYEELEEGNEEDPRRELQEKLATYAKFLKGEEFLEKRYAVASRMFSRPWIEPPLRQDFPPEIFRELKLLMFRKKEKVQVPSPGIWNLENIRKEITSLLKKFRRFGFLSHFREKGWKNLMGAFFVLLDMAKEGRLRITQPEPFGEIWVKRRG